MSLFKIRVFVCVFAFFCALSQVICPVSATADDVLSDEEFLTYLKAERERVYELSAVNNYKESIALAENIIAQSESRDGIQFVRRAVMFRVDLATVTQDTNLTKADELYEDIIQNHSESLDSGVMYWVTYAKIKKAFIPVFDESPNIAIQNLETLIAALEQRPSTEIDDLLIAAHWRLSYAIADTEAFSEAADLALAFLDRVKPQLNAESDEEIAKQTLILADNLYFDLEASQRAGEIPDIAIDLVSRLKDYKSLDIIGDIIENGEIAVERLYNANLLESAVRVAHRFLAPFTAQTPNVHRLKLAELTLDQANAFHSAGQYQEAIDAARSGLSVLGTDAGDDEVELTRSYLMANIGYYENDRGNFAAAAEAYKAVVDAFEAHENNKIIFERAENMVELAINLAETGAFDEAVNWGEKIGETYGSHPDLDIRAQAVEGLFNLTFDRKSLEPDNNVFDLYQNIISTYKEDDHPDIQNFVFRTMINYSIDLSDAGREKDALEITEQFEEQITAFPHYENRILTSNMRSNKAWYHAYIGETVQAERVAKKLLADMKDDDAEDVRNNVVASFWAHASVAAVNKQASNVVKSLKIIVDLQGSLDCTDITEDENFSAIINHPRLKRYLKRIGCTP